MKGQCVVASATIRGVRAIPVAVEVVVSSGLPGMSIVGMPDVAVQEARERVRAAIRSTGYSMPNERIVVNLAPGSLRKSGSGFDLPIAIGILAATSQIPAEVAVGSLFVGELSLEGAIRPVAGMLAFGVCALENGLDLVCSSECGCLPFEGVAQRGLSTLGRLRARDPYVLIKPGRANADAFEPEGDFGEVVGHEAAKRAFQIAAAGGHGLLMSGPPGSGKTMLASRLPSILPPLTEREMLETAVIHSVAGEDAAAVLAGVRPFRHPHHSATAPGLIGGGNPLRPGEISLAHNGVLFLDELAEFRSSVLQALRQPMESGMVCLTRADGNVAFPTRFMLVAATNPCPCGFYGDEERACSCTDSQIRTYQGKVGGPLLDRIDLQIDVKRVDPASVLSTRRGTCSADLRAGVLRARSFASSRGAHEMMRSSSVEVLAKSGCSSAGGRKGAISGSLAEAFRLGCEARRLLEESARRGAMSGRGVVGVLRVARTVADLGESEIIEEEHVAEALGFKVRVGARA